MFYDAGFRNDRRTVYDAANCSLRRKISGECASWIDCFVGPRWLITVRKNERFAIPPLLDRWDESSHLVSHGVSFLLYALLDLVVDGYFECVNAFE